MSADKPRPLLLDGKEAAALIGVERHTLDKWRKAGRIAPVQPDPDRARFYYRTADVERFIAELEAVT